MKSGIIKNIKIDSNLKYYLAVNIKADELHSYEQRND